MVFLHFSGDEAQLDRWIEREFMPHIRLPAVFLLEGELGSGKTTFVRKLCGKLGAELVTSPTFDLHHVHELPRINQRAHHLDLFRIESSEDLISLGVENIIEDTRSSVFIEWPRYFSSYNWGRERQIYRMSFKVLTQTEREIFVDDPKECP